MTLFLDNMKKGLLAAIAFGAALSMGGVETITLPLQGDNGEEAATLELYMPAQGEARGTVVVCPGGGYGYRAVEHEGRGWAQWMGERGMATAVLIYRLPRGHHDISLADCHSAISYLREHSQELGLPADKIGVMGFSAGGHLASTAATHFTEATRPDFQILMYPVITMDSTFTHMGSRQNLLGNNPAPALVELYSNEKQVTPQTPPAFICAAGDDDIVPITNSLEYYRALCKAGVPSEAAFFPKGGHGFGMLASFPYVSQMLYLLERWLTSQIEPPAE